MNLVGFEGSCADDTALAADDARLECRICWYVYDPAAGDPVWQIPPGTPFGDLPAYWRCPECDSPREQFLVAEG